MCKALPVPAAISPALQTLAENSAGSGWSCSRKRFPAARVAVLYDPATPASVRDVKEVLPVVARALTLTIQPLEVRAADDFEKVFAAMGKQRPDGIYLFNSPLMRPNRKRIADFALKSRLPSVHESKEAVEAGGLIYYGADLAESYRRVAYLRGQNPGGSQASQPAGGAADQVRVCDKSENGESDRPDDSAVDAVPGGQSH